MITHPKFQIFRSLTNDHFYYRLRARNGEIILSGEGFTSKQGCLNGIASVKENALLESRYQRKSSEYNQYYFQVVGTSKEPVGKSELYYSTRIREVGIDAVKRDARTAIVEDLT